MNITSHKIGFGGGCHWCTEAYFQSIKGVLKVEQGWISSCHPNNSFSEAVIVHYNSNVVTRDLLISIHLHTHASTKLHSYRKKYRSAVYVFTEDVFKIQQLIDDNRKDFKQPIITKALKFEAFKLNAIEQQNYYSKFKNNGFCKKYISPKLKLLEEKYCNYYKGI